VWKRRGIYKVCGEKLGGKRSLGRPRCREKDNIRMDLKGAYWESVDWNDLTEVRSNLMELVNQCGMFGFPKISLEIS
jgi:hypothetical protein